MSKRGEASRMVRTLVAAMAALASCLVIIGGTPSPAGALTTATQVSAGGRTTCALMTGGNSYC